MRSAHAQDLRVAWRAPACANEHEFRAHLQRVLRRSGNASGREELELRVEIESRAAASGFQLSVFARSEGGRFKRVLDTKTCSEALDAAALVVALAVDPNAAAAEPLSNQPSEPPHAVLALRTALLGGVAIRELPRPSPFVALNLGLDYAHFAALLEGFWLAAQRAELATGANGRGGDIGAAGAGLALCYLPIERTGRLYTCLAAQAGAWASEGTGIAHPETRFEPRLSGGPRVRYVFPLSRRVGVLLQSELVWLAMRPRFYVEDQGSVYVPPQFGARFGAGLELSY